MEQEKTRQDFPIFRQHPELAYLDSAATSQKPERVIDTVSEFYRKDNGSPGRSLHQLAEEATERYREARKNIAGFIGAGPDELVFVRNTTEAMNLVASSLEVEGRILVPEISHHSEQLPLRRKAERGKAEFDFIPCNTEGIDLDAARKMMDSDTGLVSVPHVSNVLGSELPVEELAELAHENDARIMVDGAQSVPRMPVDVKELGVDFMAFSGHKMLGPSGTGGLYGRKELLEVMEPYQVGGGMIRKVEREKVEYMGAPERFEAGTPDVAGAVGLSEAVEYLREKGMEEVWRHDQEISRMIRNRLDRIEGVKIVSAEESCLVSFRMDGIHPHDISEILDRNNVAVRAGHHCAQPLMEELNISGTVRASPYLYNTEQDVEKLVEAVREASEVFD